MIPFNKPFIVGKELHYIAEAVTRGNLSGDGHFTLGCAQLIEQKFNIPRVLMTPSCTAALEMAAQLCDLTQGDEVIMASYTFVSTASAFVRQGATPVFVDIRPDTLNIDESLIETAITERTKAICVTHYAGISCDMDTIVAVARRHSLKIVEDAAQGVNSYYKGRPLGSIGDLGCFSFHETKNYICGEGGALCINDSTMIERAEIIRDKGTDRQKFFRGEVDKYTWVEVGSSYVPSEISSAFLYAQLEQMEQISACRREVYNSYRTALEPLEAAGSLQLPVIPESCDSNYHMFYIILPTQESRDSLLQYIRDAGAHAVFHYVPLHSSPKGRELCGEVNLPVTDDMSSRLARLPFFYGIESTDMDVVISTVTSAMR